MGRDPRIIDMATLVDEVMRQHPPTIEVFVRLRLHCIGCPIGTFHTVADAAREHGLDPQMLLDELRAAAADAGLKARSSAPPA